MPAPNQAIAMLCYKAWRESRARFALSAAALAGLCLAFVVFQAELRRMMGATEEPASTYGGYIYLRIYESVGRATFWLLAIVLGLGGLWRERAHGTIGFTLALPVHRHHHAIARAGVGLLELAALAMLPAVLVPLGSTLIGESYPWTQALAFALLWIAIGGVAFAVSFLISVLVRSDYAALAISVLGLRLLSAAVALVPGLERWQLRDLMTGRGRAYFDQHTALITDIPWLVLAGALGATCALLAIAVQVTTRQRQL